MIFLDMDANALRQRLTDRVTHPGNPEADQQAGEFGLSHVEAAVAAATRQPARTLMLHSDKLTPAELTTRCWPEHRVEPGPARPQQQATLMRPKP